MDNKYITRVINTVPMFKIGGRVDMLTGPSL